MKIHLIAWTQIDLPQMQAATGGIWTPDRQRGSTTSCGGQLLAEFAGRACYQSWNKPNPATATNAGYLRHIREVGHMSVLEHASVTFYITGISRSLTHELIRHRHFSYSQLSQRYVPEHDAERIEPDVIAADEDLHQIFARATTTAMVAYDSLVVALEEKLGKQMAAEHTRMTDVYGEEICARCRKRWPCPGPGTTAVRKAARQAARSVLPNATETRIVVTGNYRTWRHFIAMRATEHADVEIRALAVECLKHLQAVAPNVFDDFVTRPLDDGTVVASSAYHHTD